MSARHTPGPLMAGIERQIAHFRADPLEADATPNDVISVANYALQIDAQRASLVDAARLAADWSNAMPPHLRLPKHIEDALRAAIAKSEGRS